VRLIRPFLRVSYDGETLSFGSLQRLIDDALAMDSTAPKPSVTIEDGSLLLVTPNGNLSAMADATMTNGQLQHLQASLERGTFKGGDYSAAVTGGTVTADFVSGAFNLKVSLDLDNASVQTFSARGVKTVSE